MLCIIAKDIIQGNYSNVSIRCEEYLY